MARASAKGPEGQIGKRRQRQDELEQELEAARTAMVAAYAILEIYERGPNTAGLGTLHRPLEGTLTIGERRRRAEEAVDLERDHEPFETIAEDEAEAHRSLTENARKVKSKTGAIETLEREIEELKAEHRDYFIAHAEEGSRGGEAQLDKLLATFDETQAALRDMWDRWTRVGIPISTTDLAHLRRELEEVRRSGCWPRRAKSAEEWQEGKAAEQAPPAARLSNREAVARFTGGERAA